jgi:hypothetical protein
MKKKYYELESKYKKSSKYEEVIVQNQITMSDFKWEYVKYNVIMAEHTVAIIETVILQVNSIFLQKLTQTFSKYFTYEAKQKYCN